ncbi:MAG: YcgN family cysteine cluster protein [Chromatiales bacterium]|nr:YcgN family cysteine cluster protein [Chromatiales bacterium]
MQAFWKHKHWSEFTPEEWESVCDGCAKCCLFRLEDEDTGERFYTNVCCDLLDLDACRCTDYPNRSRRQPACVRVTPEVLTDASWLPASCAYRLIAEGRDLPRWHPLVSAQPNAAIVFGRSIRDVAIHERDAGDLEQHLLPDYR